MKTSFVRVILFILLFALLFSVFFSVYSFKFGDGICSIQAFYEQEKNSIDVIFVGSSTIYENINTGVLWENHGLSAFDLAASMQPMWNSYYYIKECFKTQNPKLVVLDMNAVRTDAPVGDETKNLTAMSTAIKNTYGMKPSIDKIKAIKVSADEIYWDDLFLAFPTFHTRYEELTREDYLPYKDNEYFKYWKGFGLTASYAPFDMPTDFTTDKIENISDKTEYYLRKIVDLCKENDAQLLLIKTPYKISLQDQAKYNRVKQIADEVQIPFVNFNEYYDDIGVDFSTDFSDSVHMSYIGSERFTKYLGQYITQRYELPDHRGDGRYETWDIMAQFCAKQKNNAIIQQTEDLTEYLKAICNSDYTVVYNLLGEFSAAEEYDVLREALSYASIDIENISSGYTQVNTDNKTVNASYGDMWRVETAYNCWLVQDYGTKVTFNGNEINLFEYGLNIVVYDPLTKTIVDSCHFKTDSTGKHISLIKQPAIEYKSNALY